MIPSRRALVAAVLLVGVACSSGAGTTNGRMDESPGNGSGTQVATGRFADLACALPADILERTWNGYHPTRSGEIQIVPKEPNFIGRKGALSHSGPWDYLQRVPMLWYGPGQVRPVGKVQGRATMADVAPTIAEYFDFELPRTDGRPLREAILPAGKRGSPPRLVVVVVWDGGGRVVLNAHRGEWPTVHRFASRGAWYDDFTVGSSPSVTPSIHTSLGTGAFPRTHGLVDMQFLVEGDLVPSYSDGPRYLLTQSLADAWDAHTENEARVGVIGYRDWHLGMIGHGSQLEGGDKDLAVLMDESVGRWALQGTNAKFFEFPSYVNDVFGLEPALRRIDLEDGRLDSYWMGKRILDDPANVWKTPAYAEWQTNVIHELIRREGFGGDGVPDLLFANYKFIDLAFHAWGLHSPQMEAALQASDVALGDLARILDAEVGKGRWVMALTADHGVTPEPGRTGAVRIDPPRLERQIEVAFGGGNPRSVRALRPTELWLDVPLIEKNGHTVNEVAAWLARYTRDQAVPGGGALTPAERRERVFSAAWPTDIFDRLPCLPGRGA